MLHRLRPTIHETAQKQGLAQALSVLIEQNETREKVCNQPMRTSKKFVSTFAFLALAIFLAGTLLTARAPQLSSTNLVSSATPAADYRWRDVADNLYSNGYNTTYVYSLASVQVTFYEVYTFFHGTLTASNLKPNFAYQLKLVGNPGGTSNEKIGLAGRWWQEHWDGTAWIGGQNLNDKGNGFSPNPNDDIYFATRDLPSSSPTGKLYRYTGYLVFDYFITDSNGNVNLDFEAKSSYHVLWKTSQSQHAYTSQDGPLKERTLDPTSSDLGYDTDYSQSTINIYGEWERTPVGGVFLQPGEYTCKVVLTEESFHGSGGTYAGNWAGAMEGDISFSIEETPSLPVPVMPLGTMAAVASMIIGLAVTFALSMRKARHKP
jgi:hypothetical protein